MMRTKTNDPANGKPTNDKIGYPKHKRRQYRGGTTPKRSTQTKLEHVKDSKNHESVTITPGSSKGKTQQTLEGAFRKQANAGKKVDDKTEVTPRTSPGRTMKGNNNTKDSKDIQRRRRVKTITLRPRLTIQPNLRLH